MTMSRASVLVLVGFLVILIAFMGIPLSWLRILYPILGFVVVTVGFVMRSERIARERRAVEPPAPSNEKVSPVA